MQKIQNIVVPCTQQLQIEDEFNDKMFRRVLSKQIVSQVVRKGIPKEELFNFVFSPEIEPKVFNDTMDFNNYLKSKQRWFKVTDTIYLSGRKRLAVNMLNIDAGFAYNKINNYNSDWWLKIMNTINIIEKQYGVEILVLNMYLIDHWVKKTTKMNYINHIDKIPYNAVQMANYSVEKLKNKMKLDYSNKFGIHCKGCDLIKSCPHDDKQFLSLNNATIQTKIVLLESEAKDRPNLPNLTDETLDKCNSWDKGHGRLFDEIVIQDTFSENELYKIDENAFINWFDKNLKNYHDNEIVRYDFETTSTLIPVITEWNGTSQIPMVISVNNKGYISPLLYDGFQSKNPDLVQYKWIREWIDEIDKCKVAFAYNAPFEIKILKAVVKWINKIEDILPDDTDETISKINNVINKTKDLADPFSKKIIRLNGLYGGWSLKKVLEPFVGRQPYGGQQLVNNGLDALFELRKILYYRQFDIGSKERTDFVLKEIEDYCNMDTIELQTLIDKYRDIYNELVEHTEPTEPTKQEKLPF